MRTTWTHLELLLHTKHYTEAIKYITDAIGACKFDLNTENKDGRRNSQNDQNIVTEALMKAFPTVIREECPEGRELGDIYILDKPWNIKVVNESDGQSNNMAGIVALTKYIFSAEKCNKRDHLPAILLNTPQDHVLQKYGLIIVGKQTGKCWVGYLDQIPAHNIRVNPSNSLQISWPEKHIERTNEEYRKLIESKIVELMEKWAEPFKVFEREKEKRANEQRSGTILHDQ